MTAPLAAALASIGSPRILVVGDLVLDRYTWGSAERVSPEAPVLVLEADSREVRLGGAASVAGLLGALEARVTLAGVVGDDPAGLALRELLDQLKVDGSLVLDDPSRPTTTKERFIGRAAGRHAHQILRVDSETRQPLGPKLAERLGQSILARLGEHQALLISDYRKGVCTRGLLASLVAGARAGGLPVLVDPARISDYSRYRGATLLVPNRAEASLAAGQPIRTPDDALTAGRRLCASCGVGAAVVKLDSDGMVLASANSPGQHVPTRPRPVHDVTGAGDMVLAVLGLCRSSGVPPLDAVRLANVAAGLEVQRLGVAPVTRAEILAELRPSKRTTVDELQRLADAYRRDGRTIVLANGCFDLLHAGHVTYLEEASRLGDVLVVAVNSDRSVRALKGPTRPVIPQEDRAAMLAALACVDHVLVFDEKTPHELLRRLRPDVLVKGGTYAPQEVVGREVVESYGGRVTVTSSVANVSTTDILARMRSAV